MVRDRIVMGFSNGAHEREVAKGEWLNPKKSNRPMQNNRSSQSSTPEMKSKSVVLSVQEETRSQQSQKWMKNNPVKTNIGSTKPEGKIGNTINKFKTNFEKNVNNYLYKCKKCNREHGPKNCPAFGKICNLCNLFFGRM